MRRRVLAILITVVLAAAGCGTDDDTASRDGLAGSVTVLAASSLTDAFEELAAAFEALHATLDVHLTFNASSTLATQIAEGVPADVFASADRPSVERVRGADEPVVFATNRLQIAVPRGNPAGVHGLADLARGELDVALCAPEVPCGRYAAMAFTKAGLEVPETSQEANVRGVLTKVALGEADAGIVYATDVRSGPDVEGIDLPDGVEVIAEYPATALRDAPNPGAAAAFVAFLTSEAARAILEARGFGVPAL